MTRYATEFNDDLLSTIGYGLAIQEPPHHFSRIFSLFAAEERRKILDDAYDNARKMGVSKRDFTLEQFVVASVAGCFGWERHETEGAIAIEWDFDPANATALRLPLEDQIMVREVIRGNSYRGLAIVVAGTTLDPDFLTQHEFSHMFSRVVGARVLSPEQAGAVASCVTQNRKSFERFADQGSGLVADAGVFPSGAIPDRDSAAEMQHNAEWLGTLLASNEEVKRLLLHSQTEIVKPDSLFDRFDLEETASGLFIPLKSSLIIAKSMRDVVTAIERDRNEIRSLSPRRFEEVMRALFETLGFEVELTQASRDGGADLLCLRDLHGIPFRLAVEVKRYKEDRPISVSLVRSFVGANAQFQANKLVYVTTSYYTQPAKDFANNYASHLLTLTQNEQIKDWCQHYLNDGVRLL